MIEGEIDLVCENDVGYFYFKQDDAYINLKQNPPNIILNYDPRDFQHTIVETQSRFIATRSSDLFPTILSAWWKYASPDVYDVGAHVGRFSLPLGIFIRESGRQGNVYIFEPGRTSSLIPYSIEVNRLAGTAQLITSIVSDFEGVTALRFDPKHLVGARAYVPQGEYISRICHATTIDAVRRDNRSHSPSLIKIDTEGHEVQVLIGCKEMIRSGQFVISLEFRDWLMDHGAPVLNELFDLCHVFDLGDNITIPFLDRVKTLQRHVSDIAQHKTGTGHTDLLFVSKSMNATSEIIHSVEKWRKLKFGSN